MTSAEFCAIGERAFGYGWQTRMAEYLDVNLRTIGRWVSGANPIRDSIAEEVRALVQIAPPPNSTPAEDRDDACHDALAPRLNELANQAARAGWHPAEIVTTTLAWSVEQACAGSGIATTIETLRTVLRDLEASRKSTKSPARPVRPSGASQA